MEKIVLNKEAFGKQSEVHLLPCKVSYDGKANVNSFFTSSILRSTNEETKAEVLESSLRGRPLNGVNIKLNNKIGLVINEVKSKDEKSRDLELESTFDNIYSWRLDDPKITEKSDLLSKGIHDWFSASEIIHAD